ncbi:heterogeneous nuclear ribonucleoprotein 1-like [Actinidia eriantha]|uniref:heterogeneous nuclear ribonucleoprotein 1-like n=1 Tax=Actinidia eriantha TaxID=165200 RepID=UPI00258EFF2B|nr:heterogeneous nuclear ribonucleoprotein 1-like [Actinidia eriantha]XP_057481487.1 heterogeneous nuclear ribonucleoprotein 1-like [Actinidia eriantha]XP_057481488.1 heterogeneous nuclear ribonucleoprotein 1-like [Actinidia eriantha]
MEGEPGKLFVGGISQETTEETLKNYFGRYGGVKESKIIRDRNTGNGRGFGFVTFEDPSVVNNVLRDKHVILRRTVDVKEATPKAEENGNQHCQGCLCYQQKSSSSPLSNKKIFVGGLPPCLTVEAFKQYFERFGAITDVVIIHDMENNRSRGFGFITFDSEEAALSVLQSRYYELHKKSVEVKLAEPKDGNKKHLSTYDCNNLTSGFERFGLHPSYVPYCYNCGAQFLIGPYNGAASFPTEPYSGAVYYPQLCSANYSSYSTDMNGVGYTNDWASGLANGAGGDVSSQISTASGNLTENNNGGDAAQVSLDESDYEERGKGRGDGEAAARDDALCSEINIKGSGDAGSPAPRTDGASCSESNDEEHGNGADCQSTPCQSS